MHVESGLSQRIPILKNTDSTKLMLSISWSFFNHAKDPPASIVIPFIQQCKYPTLTAHRTHYADHYTNVEFSKFFLY